MLKTSQRKGKEHLKEALVRLVLVENKYKFKCFFVGTLKKHSLLSTIADNILGRIAGYLGLTNKHSD